MIEDLFESPFLLLDRAKEHLDELAARVKAFIVSTKPSKIVTDFDQISGYYTFKLQFGNMLPGNIWPVAADAIHNLRSAMDQGLCAAVRTVDPAASLRGVQFPFGKTIEDFKRACDRLRPVVRDEFLEVAALFHPYKGGNEKLWSLNSVNNLNKHRGLIKLTTTIQNVEIIALNSGFDETFIPIGVSDGNYIVIGKSKKIVKPSFNINMSFFVCFNEIEELNGMQVVDAIQYLMPVVSAFLVGIESEAKQIASQIPAQ